MIVLLHVGLVCLSVSLFIWRGCYMWQQRVLQSNMMQRLVPDVIDTLLLISGVSLAYSLSFSPWQDAWLLVKLIALVIYIMLGHLALKEGLTLKSKKLLFITSLLVVTYIVLVALDKQLWPISLLNSMIF
ncbi:MAG: SirB2 family protein [Mariprofundaceae bacterium]